MKYSIALIKGDGIGPEVSQAALAVLDAVSERFSIEFDIIDAPAGDTVLKKTGEALPKDTISAVKDADACLKGPVGESAVDVIVKLRQMFDLYANIRPAKSYPTIKALRPDVDLVIVRENTEDLYRGIEADMGDSAIAVRVISRKASERIAEYAFKMASMRRKNVIAVHKANVMRKTCGLFASVSGEVSQRHRNIAFREMYVDACAMNLIRNPQDFDVILTMNMFGDILSDEAAQVVGGLGLAPSANIGDKKALFEPVHGAAPDIAGKGIANPVATILSVKMMLEWLAMVKNDAKCAKAAEAVERAVVSALKKGVKPPELGGKASTEEVGNAISKSM
ncbi:MAG: isocitrate/isopropylmalate dehydrogenase family protein [Thaumarchaeota archaeon]|nr:isocitrate/isopropylmalate dehydrogenase family protein [Nitrososphaerota archaeon]